MPTTRNPTGCRPSPGGRGQPRRDGGRAFTLVEVALSMAVVVFALIAIVSLIAMAQANSHDSTVRQSLTLALDQIISTYQSQSFTTSLAMVQAPTNYYFDPSGASLTNATGSYFNCTVSNVTPAGAATNFVALLQVQVTWPYPAQTSTNASVFSIFNAQ